ncbi:MAG TPA: hypothetical protein VK923_10630 [Euzebyales bacterium]|nr:hypothetical protein [Euzebyales bacterium]
MAPIGFRTDSHDADVAAIVARRHDNGGDFWATAEGRVYVGNPFSTIASLAMLHELGVPADHEAVQGGLELILDACRDDGRIRVAPKAPLYPCYTAEAARVLCRFGLADHPSVQRTMRYLLDSVHGTGGWRYNFTRFGRGPDTRYANPGATLYALDALRFGTEHRAGVVAIDHAVESLLDHWETREPLGPCHWGIGTQFLRVEYPFLRHNLFFYVNVLSFYARARSDPRFAAAVSALEAKLDEAGRLVVERPHPRLRGLAFCARGEPSALATARHGEIRRNLTA